MDPYQDDLEAEGEDQDWDHHDETAAPASDFLL
jgi:hypothetical protein